MVALLFLVFDVELMFLLPYCMSYERLGLRGHLTFLLFFFILILGFLIEWSIGMLVWKGEENSPTNALNHQKFTKNLQKTKHEFLRYLMLYLKVYDNDAFNMQYRRYTLTPLYFFLKKKSNTFYSHTNLYSHNELFKYNHDYKTGLNSRLFYKEKETPFFGTKPLELSKELWLLERHKKQLRVDRFFTTIYGDRYTNWLKTLSPAQ